MDNFLDIKVPDLEGAENVPVEKVLVTPGASVNVGQALVTIETEKAIVEVPSPSNGVVHEILVKAGDLVAEDSLLLRLQMKAAAGEKAASIIQTNSSDETIKTEVVVLGSGPGGYSAAFRAADLGKKVILVENRNVLGGVCLNIGCIPSKSLLHAAKVISEAKEMRDFGLKFSSLELNLDALRAWKNKVVQQLTNGLNNLAKKRDVSIVNGTGSFSSPYLLNVKTPDGKNVSIEFEYAVIAAGSEAVKIPNFPHDDPRVLTSTEALEINKIPNRLLVVGGGIIGLEMATVYYELGAKVTIVEFMDSLIPGADKDIVKPLYQRVTRLYENIFLSTKVTSMTAQPDGIHVVFQGSLAPQSDVFDQVLVAVGRRPNGKLIGAEKAGVNIDEQGHIRTNSQMRTNVKHIFAIGDIVGQPMLAHKAAHEGKVAAEVIAGMGSIFDGSLIPSVAYTDPEIAWVAMTENKAKELNIKYGKGVFPWLASGRSLSIERKEGITKTLYDEDTKKIIGAGIVGPNAGDLISEAALAIKMGCTASEIGELIHPHPTLSETVGFSAEVFEKTIVDMYVK